MSRRFYIKATRLSEKITTSIKNSRLNTIIVAYIK
jgi:hypothetical protein